MRKPFRRRTCLALAVIVLDCGDSSAPPPPQSTQERPAASTPEGPSVLLYVVDTLRADGLPRYGNRSVETPAVDQLAREGTLFLDAQAPSSWTRASVATILTGLYPGVHGAEDRNDALSERLVLLPELFAERGYATGAVVANPNVGSFYGFDQGYDEYVELYERRARGMIDARESVVPSDQVTERVKRWIDSVEGPFFLFVLSIDPHWPYEPPAAFDRHRGGYAGRVDSDPLAITRKDLSPADRARLRSLYEGEIAFNDDSLGRLLEHLRLRGRYDDTIVVFTSDHGEEFWEHGNTMHGLSLFEESIRVPLIIRSRAGLPVAARVEAPVALVDIAPTLLELTGIPVPYALDGRSLTQPPAGGERSRYASLDLDGVQTRAITHAPWKLIFRSEGQAALLYNLELDAKESWNLAAKHPDRVATLSALLSERVATNARRRAQLVGEGAAASVSEDDLSEDARRALEALGYIDAD
ncbi:MAG: sulfatase [Deltaproteobacteria bacterium]|nr:sulfatase [Deltaproteobacteria bacterium]MBW2419549.1 sulfatase [Deltaproteobacteria bacterium]